MTSIAKNLQQINNQLPEGVRLIAVSKTQPVKKIMEAYDVGQRDFGENKVQELLQKHPILPKDIRWHFIGHLQRNKVKQLIPIVDMIHGIDSLRLLQEVNKQSAQYKRRTKCLLQFHIAMEETKFGLDLEESEALLSSHEFHQLQHIKLCGVMGMATYTPNMDQVAKEFQNLSNSFDFLKHKFFKNDPDFREKSMGMTSDFLEAIAHGSTMVRIGSAIFGTRLYY